MHGMFEIARQELLIQIHRQAPRAGVDCLVTGHGAFLYLTSDLSLVIPYGSRQDAGWMLFFYNVVRLHMADYYRFVIVETFLHTGGSSKHSIRARPMSGQGLSTSMRVECSSTMRESHPVGKKIKVWARIKSTDQTPHLYTSWQWAYEVVSADQAKIFIEKKDWGRK